MPGKKSFNENAQNSPEPEMRPLVREEKLISFLNTLTKIFVENKALDRSMLKIPKLISAYFGGAIIAIELYDREKEEMVFIGTERIPSPKPGPLRLPASETISGTVARTKEPYINLDASGHVNYRAKLLKTLNVSTFACFPMVTNDKVIGTFVVADDKKRQDILNSKKLLQILANTLALEIARSETEEKLLARGKELEKANKAITESERKWRNILLNTPQIAISLDPKGKIIFANRHFLYITGWSEQEIRGENWFDLFIPENIADEIKNIFITTMRSKDMGEFSNYENEIVTKSGELLTIAWSNVLSKDSEGRITDVTSFGVDLTERNKTASQLRKSSLMIESISDAVIACDPKGRITFWNTGAQSIYGYKKQEIIGKSIAILYKDEDIHELETMIDELLAGKELSNVEVTCIDKDHKDINILLSLMTIKDRDDHVVELVGFTKDITKLKQYQNEIIVQKDRAERYLNLAGVMFVALNLKGEVTLINEKGCEILGYTQREIVGKNWFDHFIPARLREDLKPVSRQLLKGEISEIEYYENPILNRSGEERLIGWHNTILKDEMGSITGHLSAGEDITEKRRLETQLRQSQKMESIGNLAGGIAHDFNNILSSIIGFTELAIDEAPKDTVLEDCLQEVYSAGIRAKELVKQILAFARQSDEKRSPIQPSTVAREVLNFIRSTIPTTIQIQKNIQSDSLIVGNATQIHQVFMNLCTNAAHAMEEGGGLLKIGLQDVVMEKEVAPSDMRPGDYIEIKVSDTGVGISPDIIESIFEPYFTTKEPGEGTGMGLAMVQGIIESYNGKLAVESQLGKGTTFTIYLPVTVKRSENEAYVTEELPKGTERILFVDDELPIAKMGSQILERLGYSVTARTSSIEALELFKAKPNEFDLVVTDMTMPNMPGDKLAIELMKLNGDIPIILCTGYSKKISDKTASAIGIKAFAYKPVANAELAKTVRKVLDEANS